MIVKLPNDRCVVVDSKVSLSAYLEAIDAVDLTARNERSLQRELQFGRHRVQNEITLTPHERRLAVQAARALRLDLVRIDLIRSPDDGPCVSGVVAGPGLGDMLPFAKQDVGRRIIRTIEARARAAALPVEG